MASHALATVTNPSAALTDFTLLVDLSDMPANWWSAVDTSDGTRGRVYKGDGSTRLACDWIDFDDTAETGLLRVKWTGTLATSGTQQLWIEPPVTTNATVAADDTYGSDNAYDDVIEAYWPLTSDANDRTVNGHDGTGETGITYGADTGLCGPATDFEGSYAINIGKPLGDVDFSLTVVFGSGSNTYRRILMAGNRHRTELCKWATSTELRLKPATTDECHTTIANNTAYFAQATIDINTGYSLRLNGGTAVTDTIEDEFDADIDWYIGRRSYSSEQYWDDWMQHAMLYNVLVSDDWADHEYAQIDDNATFWGSWSWVAAGGGAAQELDGDVSGSATLSGNLIVDRLLAGALSASGTLSGDAQVQRTLSGSISGSATVSGDARVERLLAGSISAQAAVSGQISTAQYLEGVAAAIATATGNLQVQRNLAAAVNALSALSGQLQVGGVVELAGSISASATVSASLQVLRNLQAALAAAGNLSGALQVQRLLSGSLSAQATISAALTVSSAWVESIAGTSYIERTMSGVSTIERTITGVSTL